MSVTGAKRAAAEPWMRGTHVDLDPLRRGVVHALELAGEDVQKWVLSLSDVEIHSEPFGLPSVAFHLRHMARSLDRLLTYAEDRAMQGGLSDTQRAAAETEHETRTSAAEVLAEFTAGFEEAQRRLRLLSPETYSEQRGIGRLRLPTTAGGLLIHCAEHTQRHAGQMVTTARLVLAMRDSFEDTKA